MPTDRWTDEQNTGMSKSLFTNWCTRELL